MHFVDIQIHSLEPLLQHLIAVFIVDEGIYGISDDVPGQSGNMIVMKGAAVARKGPQGCFGT